MTMRQFRPSVPDVQLAAVRVPTEALLGSADSALAGVKELHSVMPALSVLVIEGGTHSASTPQGIQWRPEYVNRIREFVAAHRLALGW